MARVDGVIFDTSTGPLTDDAGRVTGMIGVATDVTERFRAYESLKENEEQLRATFSQAAVGIAQVATDGRWMRVNQRLCDIVGFAERELLGRPFTELTHPDDAPGDLGPRALDDGRRAADLHGREALRPQGRHAGLGERDGVAGAVRGGGAAVFHLGRRGHQPAQAGRGRPRPAARPRAGRPRPGRGGQPGQGPVAGGRQPRAADAAHARAGGGRPAGADAGAAGGGARNTSG